MLRKIIQVAGILALVAAVSACARPVTRPAPGGGSDALRQAGGPETRGQVPDTPAEPRARLKVVISPA